MCVETVLVMSVLKLTLKRVCGNCTCDVSAETALEMRVSECVCSNCTRNVCPETVLLLLRFFENCNHFLNYSIFILY